MSPDPFDRLALALRRHAVRHAGSDARYLRCRVVSTSPLEARTEDDVVYITEHDDDVEIAAPVTTALAAHTISVGDLLDVREHSDGYLVAAVIS